MPRRLRRMPALLGQNWPFDNKKVRWLGLGGAAGGMVAALVGELILLLVIPREDSPSPPPGIDLVFVLDATGSMSAEIHGIRRGIEGFVSTFTEKNLSINVGMVAFRDLSYGEEPEIFRFNGTSFTESPVLFSRQMETLYAHGGGDEPESSLDALATGARLPFRKEAVKVMVLITDASPRVPDRSSRTVADAARILQDEGIDQLHMVINDFHRQHYKELGDTVPGNVYSLAETASGRQSFDSMLPEISERIIDLIPTSPIISAGTENPRQVRLLFVTGLWTGLLGAGVCLSLIAVQNQYMGRPMLMARQARLGGVGSFLVGLAAGALGQWMFAVAASIMSVAVADTLGRIMAWVILGALLAIGMTNFVPNLARLRSLVGGAIGGALGALAFLVAVLILGDTTGRVLGAAMVGLCIGAMVAVVEAMFREAWLEVEYGANEKRSVSLGRQPVTVGSDASDATVYVDGALPVALRYILEGGKIYCQDVASGQQHMISPGDVRAVGKATVRLQVAAQAQAQPSAGGFPSVSSERRLEKTTSPAPTPASPTAIANSPQNDELYLRIRGKRFEMKVGTKLRAIEIPGLETGSSDQVVAEVVANPNDPSVLGLKNHSTRAWEIINQEGKSSLVDPGRSARLAEGTKLRFGLTEGVVSQSKGAN